MYLDINMLLIYTLRSLTNAKGMKTLVGNSFVDNHFFGDLILNLHVLLKQKIMILKLYFFFIKL